MRKFPLFSLCLALSLVLAAPVFAVDFSKFKHLVIFGDSLSDDGNSLALTGQPPAPYGSTFAAEFIYRLASRGFDFSVISSR
jgi:phospholipase/lecithinase/hemolysin